MAKPNVCMVDRWMKDENLEKFLRQVHTDMYVGLKNRLTNQEEIEETVSALLVRLADKLTPKVM